MDDEDPKADIACGSEARLAASAATGERPACSADPDSRDNDGPPAAGAQADGSRRGSRSRRSGSTPRPNTSSRRHKHRSQGSSSPVEGARADRRPQDSQEAQDCGGRPRALLSCCKGETHSHREGFRRLARRLHDAGWQPEKLNPRAASLVDGPVTPKALQGADLAVFGCPTRAFTVKEIAALHAFVDQGGSVAVFACAADSSDADVSTNLNVLLGRYGIAVNRDALFSIVQQGALHPREVLVSDGPLCTAAAAAAAEKAFAADTTAGQEAAAGIGSAGGTTPHRSRGAAAAAAAAAPAAAGKQEAAAAGAELLCCSSCTLAVSGAAQPLLLSGSVCNPPLRPLAAAWRGERGGAVVAFGTAAVFDGEALQRPGNAATCDLLFRWLRPGSDADLGLPPMADSTSKARRRPLDIVQQSEQPRVCFQLEPPLPGDWTQLFADDLFEFALRLPPDVQEVGRCWHQNSWEVGSRYD